jgi:hypothetical protein
MARDYGKTVDEVRDALFAVAISPKSGGQLEGGPEAGAADGDDGGSSSPVLQVLEFATGKKSNGQPKAPVQNRQQPEQNGEDAPTMEQMSMLVGSLVEKFDAILARLDAEKTQ